MAERKTSYCRICEAFCGIAVTVEGERVLRIEGDPDHPLSRGYLCAKGAAMVEVQHDPDRVTHPLRRTGAAGEFERVTWDEALDDIGRRLKAVIDATGGGSVGWYMGNPGTWSVSHPVWIAGFLAGLKSRHSYSSASQDVNSRFAASALLYGNPLLVPIPDLPRTSFLLMIGANPLVSHGSLVVAPRIREHLDGIVSRGGRVVVVDPRRSETARRYEHIGLRADSDVWLLLSLLHVLFAEDLVDRAFLAKHATGGAELERLAADFAPEATEARTGVSAWVVRSLARDFAGATSAVAYGRVGTCLGRHATLVVALLDALNVVTGNLHTPGGAVFGYGAIATAKMGKRARIATYDTFKSRVGGFPEVLGGLPSAVLAPEITRTGEGQLRALFVSAGNPVLTAPDSARLEEALGELDLLVSLDLYMNETNRLADYILPATTWLERADVHTVAAESMVTPFTQASRAMVAPAGEAREEWEIIEAIARRVRVAPYAVAPLRWLARIGLRLTPRRFADMALRAGPAGNWFGLRPGRLTLRRLERKPHGVVLADHVPTGRVRRLLAHRDRKVHLLPPPLATEAGRLHDVPPDPDLPLRLIGMRQTRSHNSWMHNSDRLMGRGHVQRLQVHPSDASAAGIADEGEVRIVSATGEVVVTAHVTDDMTPGNVALPHGWGHRGGWRLANEAGGANVNLLTSAALADVERLAGMSHLNGVPVRIEPVVLEGP